MADVIVKSVAKGVGISPRKIKEVVGLVRGRTVEDALVILSHTPRRGAVPVSKLIVSAKANASNNHNLKADSLVINEIYVTAGQRLKRYRPAAHGRALPFQKRLSHITVTVTGEAKPVKKAATITKSPNKPAQAKAKETK